MQKPYALGLVLLFTIPLVSCEDDDEVRDPKLSKYFRVQIIFHKIMIKRFILEID